MNFLQCRREKSCKSLCKLHIQKKFALLSKSVSVPGYRLLSSITNMKLWKSATVRNSFYIVTTTYQELLQPFSPWNSDYEVWFLGNGLEFLLTWHVSLLWCTNDCLYCRFPSGSSPLSKAVPNVLSRGTFFSSQGSWHTVSFYPHLHQKTLHYFCTSFLCN